MTVRMATLLVLRLTSTARLVARWLVMGLLGVALWPSTVNRSSWINLGRHKQLFIDDFIISSSQGLSRRIQEPTKWVGNPVLPAVLIRPAVVEI